MHYALSHLTLHGKVSTILGTALLASCALWASMFIFAVWQDADEEFASLSLKERYGAHLDTSWKGQYENE